MQETRQHIKTRMLKNAARAWGYPETEAENNFDPLVTMLLSACSIELEKISGEIQASRARMLERLVQLLSPDVLTGALPAHAIACALPVEHTTELTAETQLYTHRKLPAINEGEEPVWKDIFFTPTSSFRLNRASVRFMATGNQLFRINHTISKEVIAHAEAGNELPSSTLWIAIDEPGISLHGSSFYFDFRNEAYQQLFLNELPVASWYCGDDLLQHLSGYGREISGEHLDIHNILHNNNDVYGGIKKHINAYYKSSFITLLDEEGRSTKKDGQPEIPLAIATVFTGKEIKLLQQQPLRWISIRFPEVVANRLLQDVVCIMNCFPVMNSRLHEMSHRLQEIINVIPLHTEDLFLDLEQVSNDEGQVLNVHSEEGDHLAVLMRNGGVGRFDERDAAKLIDYLLQLLRDDSAAFSALGNDFISSELKQLQQSINKLEQRLFNRAVHREQIPYLVIRNQQKAPWQNLFVRYWSTVGTEANNIKSGTGLQLYKGGALENNLALLVTTTCGGRNKLSTTENVLAYKSALLSKDRLVTKEDIKIFCHYQLGERVKQIDVQKGVMISPGNNQGYTRTIDVVIGVHKKAFESMEENGELTYWNQNLQKLLQEKSTALTPYRVFIQMAA